jgi:hypothetical protein
MRAAINATLDLSDENSGLLHEALIQHTRTTAADLAPLNEEV